MLKAIEEQFDRLPPHSIEAEMQTLNSMMLCGGNEEIIGGIRALVGRDAFFQADHQIIFDAICAG